MLGNEQIKPATARVHEVEYINRKLHEGYEADREEMEGMPKRFDIKLHEPEAPMGSTKPRTSKSRHRRADAPGDKTTKDDNRIEIDVSLPEIEIRDATLVALSKLDNLYCRDGRLVSIVTRDGSPRIVEISEHECRSLISSCCRYMNGIAEAKIFGPHVKQVFHASKHGNIRELAGIVEAPYLRPDGSVQNELGYDPTTGFVRIASGCEFERVPDAPTNKQVAAACDLFEELLGDFPFPDASHLAASVAAYLTPLARPAIAGPVPFFLVDASIKSSGKSILANIACAMARGCHFDQTGFPKDESDMAKKLVSYAREGWLMVLFDNIGKDRVVGGDTLEAMLTGHRFSERLMRTNTTFYGSARTVLYGTGNRVAVGEDMLRRVCRIRLESKLADPSKRSGFRIKDERGGDADLVSHVLKNRAKYVNAALTILRGYYAAGQPDMSLPTWASYGDWSRCVRAALVWTGRFVDPAGTQADLASDCDDATALTRQIVEALEMAGAAGDRWMTSKELLDLAESGVAEGELLADLFAEHLPVNTKKTKPVLVGLLLAEVHRRRIDGRYLDKKKMRGGYTGFQVCRDEAG